MGKTECLLTKDRGKFLLLLDLLFVKDPAELIECILCITAEGRDILRRILPDIDGAGRDGRRCPAARIVPLTGMEMRDQSLLSDAFIVGKISEGNTLLLPGPCHSAPHIMVTKFIP